MKLKIELREHALVPTKGHNTDAGLDLYLDKDSIVWPFTRKLLPTGLKMAIEKGWCGIIKSRSSLASKKSLDVKAGVIDCDYRGEVKICIHNHGFLPVKLKRGDRIGQMLFVKVPEIELSIGDVNEDTERGSGGFGSTGE